MAQEEKTGHTAGPLEINPWQPEDGHTLVCGGIGQSYGLVAEFLTKADAVEAIRRWNAFPALVEALDRIFSLVSYANIHGVGAQPEPREDGKPQPVRLTPEEFMANFQEIGRLAAGALKNVG